MGRAAVVCLLTACGLHVAPPAAAECAAPWQRLRDNGEQIARPDSLIMLSSVSLVPLLLAPTGGDYELRLLARQELAGRYDLEPVSIVAPYVVAGGTLVTWGVAALAEDCDWQKAPTAMIQGMAWTLGAVALTKWVTGRAHPTGGRDPDGPDRFDHPEDAHRFQPFGGIDTAFPSGHTAILFAAAAALRTSSPELGGWQYLGYPIAVGVGVGMWFGDHHWASDVIAGALAGEALGASAGRAWSEPPSERAADAPRGAWMVVPTDGGGLLGYGGRF